MTITFYNVRADVDNFQYFLIERDRPFDPDDDPYNFEGTRKGPRWKPPRVRVEKPRMPEADFFSFGLGTSGPALAVRPEAFQRALELRQRLERVAELLLLPYDGREFSVINPLEVVDALDPDATTWDTDPETGEPDDEVVEPRFRVDRLRGDLFQVPETLYSNLYTWERTGQELKPYVEDAGLTGLVFDELYVNDD